MMATDGVIVEKAVPVNAAAIRKLAVEANIDAWSETDYISEIERTDSYVLIARVKGTICGFLVARLVPGKANLPDLDLYNIAVRPPWSRLGFGTALLSELLNRIASKKVENIWLEVRESNLKAIKFYKKHSFIEELTRANFYANPVENAVIMRLKLATDDQVNSM